MTDSKKVVHVTGHAHTASQGSARRENGADSKHSFNAIIDPLELLAVGWVKVVDIAKGQLTRKWLLYTVTRTKSVPAKDTPLSTSPRRMINKNENGRQGEGSSLPLPVAHQPVRSRLQGSRLRWVPHPSLILAK